MSESQTSARTDVVAGATTFLTMAYIIFVQPAVLSGRTFGIDTGMDFGAVTTLLTYVLAIVLVLYFVFVRSKMG